MRLLVTLLLLAGSMQAVQSPPDRIRSLVDRARVAEEQNRLDEAVALYEEILRLRPGWASAELNLGLVYHSRGDYSKAIQTLTSALRHNSSLHSALLFRGGSYYHTGRYDDAVRDLTGYLKHDPESRDALSVLANSHLARNDPAQAALAYAALARLNSDPATYFQLSECYVQLARNAVALLTGEEAQPYRVRVSSAEKLAETEPCEVPEDAELTAARCGAGRAEFEEATRILIKVAKRPQAPPKTIYLSAGAYLRLAQAAVAKLFAVGPTTEWAALLRAQSAEQSNDLQTAEKEFEFAVASPGASLESYVRFGQFQARQSQFARAQALYQKALALEPDNPRIMGLIGEVHALSDQPGQAIPFLETALRANPRETQTRLYLAQSLIQVKRSPEAIRILEAAPVDPEGRILYLLGRTYQQQGETEKAHKAMEEFRRRRKTEVP